MNTIPTRTHLIHIGFPRCGSTYLQRWFAAHPQINMQGMSFGGYPDALALCRAVADPAEQNYRYDVTSCEALSLPFYGVGRNIIELLDRAYDYPIPVSELQRRVCERLADLFPGAKILIVTRGFCGLLPSLYHQYVRMGYQGTCEEMCRRFAASGAADYDAAIILYREAFGAENVLLMPFEMLREAEKLFTHHLETELGLEPAGIVQGSVNASLSPLELSRCRNLFGAFRRLRPILGEKRFRKLHNNLTMRSLTGGLDGVLKSRWLFRSTGVLERSDVAEETVEMCRGKAELLCKLPLYAPYLCDYLPEKPGNKLPF